MSHEQYANPLVERYASREMAERFGDQRRYGLWRRLWLALARAQRRLGLNIPDAALDEMAAQLDEIDFAAVAAYERRFRHDVMAHVHAFGDAAPAARGIIHLGATSAFVTDNADLILFREALAGIARRLAAVIDALGTLAARYRALPTLGLTHLQPAQPTTVGRRAALWAYDLVMDLADVERRAAELRLRGATGTTGTQASFLELFAGDHDRVAELNRLIAAEFGFADTYVVTGQTYSRKIDVQIVDALSGIAQSAHKMCNDLRILISRKECDEPFESDQIGSSAMAYKRNPMRCERATSLARFVMSLQSSPAHTLATQWMERTLDDSANRRLVMPQAFLAVDAILILLENIVRGLVIYPQVIERNLREELPMMATENLLMAAVQAGGDRQELHEVIRRHAVAAAAEVKQKGRPNDLVERLKADPHFRGIDISGILDPERYIGRAPEQVDRFIAECVEPVRQRYASHAPTAVEVEV
jgi:adenylosuccinate lyase